MHLIDWTIVAAYCIFTLGVGIYFTRRASRSTEDFFVGGRSLPWWIAGTSMVATTFAADTPLTVTEMVRGGGIASNWLWWNVLLGMMMGVFLFARLWRRSGVLTDVELVQIRYSGTGASILRVGKVAYFGVLYNCWVMGWVILAMKTILEVTTDLNPTVALIVCTSIALFYSLLSGLVGVVMTDLMQFAVAMIGAILFAILAVNHVGGIDGLTAALTDAGRAEYLNFMPDWGSGKFKWGYTLVLFSMVWWAAHNADGGGYVVQRMLACKDERHALLATLWFNVALFAVRSWPWIMVALVSLVLFPQVDGADNKRAYVQTMMQEGIVPVGLMGLLFVSFVAAFMSTIDTHLNWGTSLLVNDLYKRFLVPNRSDKHYLLVSRLLMVLLMLVATGVSLLMDSIADAWKALMTLGSGIGIVLILRWFWWRINAWSELAAMIASLTVSSLILPLFDISPKELWPAMPITVGFSLVVTLIVTYATPPTERKTLLSFFRRVQPSQLGWGPVIDQLDPSELRIPRGLHHRFLDWVAGSAMVYCLMFAIGHAIFGRYGVATGLGLGAVATGGFLWWHLSKANWQVTE